MSQYPATIRRCQHIKANGTQCGSPALRDEKCCYFHTQWRRQSRDINMNFHVRGTITLPTLEDANSIQVGLAEVMRLLVTNQIDHRTASLLLRALRTASTNLKHTTFEPEPTQVVIDPESVERRPIGATAWSKVEGREYDEVKDEVKKDDMKEEQANVKKPEKKDEMSKEAQEFMGRPAAPDRRRGACPGLPEQVRRNRDTSAFTGCGKTPVETGLAPSPTAEQLRVVLVIGKGTSQAAEKLRF